MTDDPIQSEYREKLNKLASVIDHFLNGGVEQKLGFCLFMFEFDKIDGNRINYISNAERTQMHTALREYLARATGNTVITETKQ